MQIEELVATVDSKDKNNKNIKIEVYKTLDDFNHTTGIAVSLRRECNDDFEDKDVTSLCLIEGSGRIYIHPTNKHMSDSVEQMKSIKNDLYPNTILIDGTELQILGAEHSS